MDLVRFSSSAVVDQELRCLASFSLCIQQLATSMNHTTFGRASILLLTFFNSSSSGSYHCFLDGNSVTDSTRRRFDRLFVSRTDHILVEKSPINALRIGFLEALTPEARFIHIVRDGVDVVLGQLRNLLPSPREWPFGHH